MNDDLVRAVATAVRNPNWGNQTPLDDARIAIRTVIEAVAAEAEAEPFMDFTGDWERSSSAGFADWLRAHLHSDPEATDG